MQTQEQVTRLFTSQLSEQLTHSRVTKGHHYSQISISSNDGAFPRVRVAIDFSPWNGRVSLRLTPRITRGVCISAKISEMENVNFVKGVAEAIDELLTEENRLHESFLSKRLPK